MSRTQIVLAILNILAVGVLIYFGKEVFVKRYTWVNELNRLERERDGLTTKELEEETKPGRYSTGSEELVALIAKIKQVKPEEVRNTLDPDLNSEQAKRDEITIQKLGQPSVTPGSREWNQLMKKLGPDNMREYLLAVIQQKYRELRAQERAVITEHNRLTDRKQSYQQTNARYQEDVNTLKQIVQDQKAETQEIRDDIQQMEIVVAENLIDMEENLNALNMARNRLTERQNTLRATEQQIERLTNENQQLVDVIRKLGNQLSPINQEN